ncbi:hypothetical protein AKJ38_01000 [candidate division MSBL1 archaeon SCGC-AAA259I14]|uniref:Uncharacterized protein n=1 Tax=candidate division MSBL1 archaeon SCGC-AAA259I14 TaxID=1698268 RepID=A0A133UTJ0_9EURY|nr:hypothetical protein AKJ38_01000 [candidate division MSBL1 archaeon SCGC-AAA259I14]
MQREYKEAVAIGIGGGMGGSVLIYAITGEFPWNYGIIFSIVFSIVFLYNVRRRLKNISEKNTD